MRVGLTSASLPSTSFSGRDGHRLNRVGLQKRAERTTIHDDEGKSPTCASRKVATAAMSPLPFGGYASTPPGGYCRVVDDAEGKGSKVVAEVIIAASVDDVLGVLTDYSRLAAIVPNLASCRRVYGGTPGRVRLAQVGISQCPFFRIEARCTLDVWHESLGMGGAALCFRQVEGDFDRYEGRWCITPNPSSSNGAYGHSTLLRYELYIMPKKFGIIPRAMLRQLAAAGLPANLGAIRDEAERRARAAASAPGIVGTLMQDDDVGLPENATLVMTESPPAPEPEPAPRPWALFFGGGETAAKASSRRQTSDHRGYRPSTYLGLSEVRIPQMTMPPAPKASGGAASDSEAGPGEEYITLPSLHSLDEDLEDLNPALTQGQSQQQQQQSQAPARTPPPASPGGPRYPAFHQPGVVSGSPALAANTTGCEVHIRRLDSDQMIHRRAVASVTIDAPLRDVWAVLTDYPALTLVSPNLEASEVLRSGTVEPSSPSPSSDPWRYVRLRQVAFKDLPYIRLRGEAVLDVVEKPHREIQFRAVEGPILDQDVETFQGKWMLEPVGGLGLVADPEDSSDSESEGVGGRRSGASGERTLLKYALEIKVPTDGPLAVGPILLEPLLERLICEDIAANLASIRARVEVLRLEAVAQQLMAEGKTVGAQRVRARADRGGLGVASLASDIALLEAELAREFGGGRMPSREEIRAKGRFDLERACRAHGGVTAVAARLGWERPGRGARMRPKGFWSDLNNVRAEIDRYNRETGRDPKLMPGTKELRRAGRVDLSRVVERYGGRMELAKSLGLLVPASSRSVMASLDDDDDVDLDGEGGGALMDEVDADLEGVPAAASPASRPARAAGAVASAVPSPASGAVPLPPGALLIGEPGLATAAVRTLSPPLEVSSSRAPAATASAARPRAAVAAHRVAAASHRRASAAAVSPVAAVSRPTTASRSARAARSAAATGAAAAAAAVPPPARAAQVEPEAPAPAKPSLVKSKKFDFLSELRQF